MARRIDGFGDVDYAIIRLDRPVLDREPLKVDFNAQVKMGMKLSGIGFPTGLPEKVTDNGAVVELKNSQAFGSDLDLFAGNSGSPIFDENTGSVIAINSNGQTDYVRNGSCKVARVCEVGNCVLSYHSGIWNLKDEPALRSLK